MLENEFKYVNYKFFFKWRLNLKLLEDLFDVRCYY